MTNRRRGEDEGQPTLLQSRDDVRKALAERIVLGKRLGDAQINSPAELESAEEDFKRWDDYNRQLLPRLFDGPTISREYAAVTGPHHIRGVEFLGRQYVEDFRRNVGSRVNKLESFQGRLELMAEAMVEPMAASPQAAIRASSADPRFVFVVHGRDEQVRSALFDFLRALDLRPLEWEEAIKGTGKASPYIGEVLDYAFDHAQAVVVLMTPDDEARLRPELLDSHDPDYEKNLTPQARPNVLFEAGIAFGRNAERTLMVTIGDLRPFSDVAGRHTVRMDNSAEKRTTLAGRLQGAGCPVNRVGNDWLRAGDFTATPAPGGPAAQTGPKTARPKPRSRYLD